MDTTDIRLLDLLDANARESISSLAIALNVSRATVSERMRKLEGAGVIAGYGLRKGAAFERRQISAHVMISVDTRTENHVLAELRKMNNIRSLYAVSGAFDMIAVVRGETTDEIDQSLDAIRSIKGVAKTVSSILLSTKLSR